MYLHVKGKILVMIFHKCIFNYSIPENNRPFRNAFKFETMLLQIVSRDVKMFYRGLDSVISKST